MIYAGFWRRCFAFTADFFIVLLIYMVLGVFLLGRVKSEDYVFFGPDFFIFFFLIMFLYFTVLEASPFKAGLGKLLAGIKVYDMSGSKLPLYKSAVRSLIKTALLFPFCCAFIFGVLMLSIAIAALVVEYPTQIDVVHSVMFCTVTQSSFFTLKSLYAFTPFIAFAYILCVDTEHKQYIHDFPVKSVVAYKNSEVHSDLPKKISYPKAFIVAGMALLCLIVSAVKFSLYCNPVVSTCLNNYYKNIVLWDKQYLSDIQLTINTPFEFSSGRRDIQMLENDEMITFSWSNVKIDYLKKINDEDIKADIKKIIGGGIVIREGKIKNLGFEGKKIVYEKKKDGDTSGYGTIIIFNTGGEGIYLISLFSKISQSVNEKIWRSIEIKK